MVKKTLTVLLTGLSPAWSSGAVVPNGSFDAGRAAWTQRGNGTFDWSASGSPAAAVSAGASGACGELGVMFVSVLGLALMSLRGWSQD